jgi:hypothetical protein
VEIVNRSEFHSAASLNKAAAPNSCHFFDQRPSCADAKLRSRFASAYSNATTTAGVRLTAARRTG